VPPIDFGWPSLVRSTNWGAAQRFHSAIGEYTTRLHRRHARTTPAARPRFASSSFRGPDVPVPANCAAQSSQPARSNSGLEP